MSENFDFDAAPDGEQTLLEPLPTVDRVGFQQIVAPPASPLVSDEIADAVYTLFSKGYSRQNIAVRKNLPLKTVADIIQRERKAREDIRKTDGVMSIEDSISFYSEIKIEALERAKYSDDRFAPLFLKEATEAQRSIDKLLGVDTPGMKLADRGNGDDFDGEGLVVYQERKPIILSSED